jgi:predicted NAD/FAD-dependent oxidoreductase
LRNELHQGPSADRVLERGPARRRRLLQGALSASALGALPACSPPAVRSWPGRMLGMPPAGHRMLAANPGDPAPALHRQARVVIAGGGIAGLAAACALQRAGVRDLLLLEALDETGGNSSWGRNRVSSYPWGAHYVPLVRADCRPVRELFAALGIIRGEDAHGRPVYEETYLSADPQERLWIYGRWQEGFVPLLGASAQDRAQFGAFFAQTEQLKRATGADGRPVFAIPVDASSADPRWRELDRISIVQYLQQRGWNSARLLWYVNYCCLDDYGTRADQVSAWAGLHYFAARNGVAANADPTSVVTWPEGNGFLARELAARGILAAGSVQTGAAVTRIARQGKGVTLDYFDTALDRPVRVEAAAAVVCLPRFVAARVLRPPAGARGEAAAVTDAGFSYAPWMVANVTLSRLPGGEGMALAWDNVIYDSPLLGYVVATHQDLAQVRRQTVLTYYWPLSAPDPRAAREAAYARTLSDWQQDVARDLLRVHPELAGHIENIDVRLWGHGMIRPTPGFIWGEERRSAQAHAPPIYFAHSDLSGISIFEEAYCRGLAAGELAARHLSA